MGEDDSLPFPHPLEVQLDPVQFRGGHPCLLLADTNLALVEPRLASGEHPIARTASTFTYMAAQSDGLRLTELLASLSLATDLGTGQPLGHGLRTCLLAVRLAWDMGLGIEDVRAVHSVSLLRFLGCTADPSKQPRWLGATTSTSTPRWRRS